VTGSASSVAGDLEITYDVEVSINDADLNDPAVGRVQRDMNQADRLGLDSTPSFLLLVEGEAVISAGPRLLPELLNSATVQKLLLLSPRPQ